VAEDRTFRIREAAEEDAQQIVNVFAASYGETYMYPEFYDEHHLKKMIFGDDTLMLVAEDAGANEIVGTASVVLEIGAYTDLLGEFGRLVVHPDCRGCGIGKLLMQRRLERVRDRLHVGLTEARTVHPFSVKIAQKHGFAPVGFIPMKLKFGADREHPSILVQYFGGALDLRRNHPRIIPEVYHLAATAMQNVGLNLDVIVDEEAAPYSHGHGFDVQQLTAEGYSSLLRIERGRVRHREIFGPMRLHYGFFKLAATDSTYLIARDKGRIAGAVGFTHDELEQNLRIFEFIYLSEEAIRFLIQELEQRARDEWGICTIEIDVSAYAPRMQRTLLELGFLPVAYVPAMAFHRVERRDAVKMSRLLKPLELGEVQIDSPAKDMADLVLRSYVRKDIQPKIAEAVDRIGLFARLTDEQARRVARTFGYQSFDPGATVFDQGDPSEQMYILLDGSIDVRIGDSQVGTVGPGECLGEVSLLSQATHSARAVVRDPVEAGVLTRAGLTELVRRRPDIGVALYQNLARGLGEKLRRADMNHVPQTKVDLT
jgi:GNAT superfamily N-acetyltransferase